MTPNNTPINETTGTAAGAPSEAGPTPVNEPAPPTGPRHTPSQRVRDQIDRCFRYRSPKGTQVARYLSIRDHAHAFATMLAENCPESRELALALTHLEDAMYAANAAIARNEVAPSNE